MIREKNLNFFLLQMSQQLDIQLSSCPTYCKNREQSSAWGKQIKSSELGPLGWGFGGRSFFSLYNNGCQVSRNSLGFNCAAIRRSFLIVSVVGLKCGRKYHIVLISLKMLHFVIIIVISLLSISSVLYMGT